MLEIVVTICKLNLLLSKNILIPTELSVSDWQQVYIVIIIIRFHQNLVQYITILHVANERIKAILTFNSFC